MSRYRRAKTTGGTYFFTVVSYRRQAILCDGVVRNALREAIKSTQIRLPFTIDAWVLLPDHLHCVWTLPSGDANFAKRWAKIKRDVSITCGKYYKRIHWVTKSKIKHRESTLWQRRYWEHQIRDQDDFNRHIDYTHYNPVKHGMCEKPIQWPYSTLHRYIKNGKYTEDWGTSCIEFKDSEYGE